MAKRGNSTQPALTEAQRKEKRTKAFVRVVEPRTDKAVKAISLVGECSSPNYLYTPIQAKAVTDVLEAAVKVVKSRFAGEAGKTGGFTLPK